MQYFKGAVHKPYPQSKESAAKAAPRLPDDPKKLIYQYCKKSDTEAFTAFYRQQANRLWRFLVARGCDTETAYDILSETFLRFTRTVCKDPRAPVALLYRIAINLRIDHYRRDSHSPVETGNDRVDVACDDSSNHSIDEHEHLRCLVRTLEPKEQDLLLMRYWLGLTHREVAQALGIPGGTVRRQSAEVLKKLKKALEDTE